LNNRNYQKQANDDIPLKLLPFLELKIKTF